MCGFVDVDNLFDGNLGNFVEDNNLLSLSIIIFGIIILFIFVCDILWEYLVGLWVGFVLNFFVGLFSIGLFIVFELRIYNDGVLVEMVGSGVMSLFFVDVLGINGV